VAPAVKRLLHDEIHTEQDSCPLEVYDVPGRPSQIFASCHWTGGLASDLTQLVSSVKFPVGLVVWKPDAYDYH